MTITETSPEADAPVPPEEPSPTDLGSTAGTDHKVVGTVFVAAAMLFLLVGGALAVVMRAQLAAPDLEVAAPSTYRQLFTMHGLVMVYLFLLPLWLGLASALVPLQIGATRMAFPRVHAFSLWLFLAGGAMVVAAPLVSDVVAGWALSAPLPEGANAGGEGVDMVVLGLVLVAVAAITVAVNVLATVLQLRTPGLTMSRLPAFTWSVTVSSAVLLLALPVLVGALLMLFVDRHYGGTVFAGFTGSRGGNPLMWPRLFWFAAYPTLWALLLPALGAVTDMVPTFLRRRFDHRRVVGALAAVGVLAFAGWGSEVDTLRRARPLFALGALVVLVPVAWLVSRWLLAVAGARRDPSLRERVRSMPVLHALGCASLLAVGLAGGLVAALDAGGRSHQNYWAVATQHTLFFGAATVGGVAALWYWAPKLWGRHLSESMGRLQLATLVGGMHLAFLPLFLLGIQDMGARTAAYEDGAWAPANIASSVGTAVLVLGIGLVVLNLLVSVVAGRGRAAAADPWGGHSLEWFTDSPPPPDNFRTIPEVRSETPLLDLDRSDRTPTSE